MLNDKLLIENADFEFNMKKLLQLLKWSTKVKRNLYISSINLSYLDNMCRFIGSTILVNNTSSIENADFKFYMKKTAKIYCVTHYLD